MAAASTRSWPGASPRDAAVRWAEPFSLPLRSREPVSVFSGRVDAEFQAIWLEVRRLYCWLRETIS
jgi:hypothetical protein